MAKFNIEVELDWVDEEAGYTIDEEISKADYLRCTERRYRLCMPFMR